MVNLNMIIEWNDLFHSFVMIMIQILCADSPVLKDDKLATGTNDNNAPGRPGSTSNRRHKTKVSVEKEKVGNEFPRGESSKSRREVKVDYKALSEGKQKRKNKSTSFEVFIEEEKPTDKLLHSTQCYT